MLKWTVKVFLPVMLGLMGTGVFGQEREPIWVNVIVSTETDALSRSKKMGFVPIGDVTALPTTYYFTKRSECIQSMKDRLIWATGQKEVQLLYNGIEEQGAFITAWRDGELYTHHRCIKLFPK